MQLLNPRIPIGKKSRVDVCIKLECLLTKHYEQAYCDSIEVENAVYSPLVNQLNRLFMQVVNVNGIKKLF